MKIYGNKIGGGSSILTTPIQVTGLKAVGQDGGVLLTCDPVTEPSAPYLKDLWVVWKKKADGPIQNPYDGQHMTFAPSQPITSQPLSALKAEDKIKLPHADGKTFTKFKVIGQGMDGMPTGAVTLWYDDSIMNKQWNSSGDTNIYWDTCNLRGELNSTFYNQFHETVKNAVLVTSYYILKNTSTRVDLVDNVCLFAFSRMQYVEGRAIPYEGAQLPYFASNTQRAFTSNYWTITRAVSVASVWYMPASGDRGTGSQPALGMTQSLPVRPYMNLKPDTLISLNPDSDGCYTVLV